MGLYNFQPRFVELILNGTKRQTIRAWRKHPDGPGSMLYLYTGLRHPGARLLARAECTWAEQIKITPGGRIIVNGIELTPAECEELAQRDGFTGHADMMGFWAGRLPFVGQIIGWAKLEAERDPH